MCITMDSGKYFVYCRQCVETVNHYEVDIIWEENNELTLCLLQYIPINMHTVFALLCFVVVIDWLSHIHQAYFTGTVAI